MHRRHYSIEGRVNMLAAVTDNDGWDRVAGPMADYAGALVLASKAAEQFATLTRVVSFVTGPFVAEKTLWWDSQHGLAYAGRYIPPTRGGGL